MPIIHLELLVRAPIERVFDASRSVDVHVASTSATEERAVAGVTTGLLELDDVVTWEAKHFGVRQRLTSRIVSMSRPLHFRDSMVSGAFRRFDHDHTFSTTNDGTLVTERFDFDAPLGPLGDLANLLFLTSYMRRFLTERLHVIRDVAESDRWKAFLVDRQLIREQPE
jgi:ligand-binding SRPBCC domain-containing protein